MPYNSLYLNKGNNSSVKGSILTKLIGYREFMVHIICTNNELNLTNRYWDMVPDRQKVRTDGMDGRRQNYIPPTSSGDNKKKRCQSWDAPLLTKPSGSAYATPYDTKNWQSLLSTKMQGKQNCRLSYLRLGYSSNTGAGLQFKYRGCFSVWCNFEFISS